MKLSVSFQRLPGSAQRAGCTATGGYRPQHAALPCSSTYWFGSAGGDALSQFCPELPYKNPAGFVVSEHPCSPGPGGIYQGKKGWNRDCSSFQGTRQLPSLARYGTCTQVLRRAETAEDQRRLAISQLFSSQMLVTRGTWAAVIPQLHQDATYTCKYRWAQMCSRRLCALPAVLVSAGTELTLFLVAGAVLCFGFGVRTMLITL